MKLPILVDCDGVLADYVNSYCVAARFLGYDALPGMVASWDTAACLGVSPSDDETIRERLLDPISFEKTPWCDEFLAGLRELDRPIWCVTKPMKRNSRWEYSRMRWLSHVGIYNVIQTDDKVNLRSCSECLIDDNEVTIREWGDFRRRRLAHDETGILFPAPYNSGVGDWKTVLEQVREVCK